MGGVGGGLMGGVAGGLMGMGEVAGGGMGGVVRVIPCFCFIIMQVNHKLHEKLCFCHLLPTKMDNEYTRPNPEIKPSEGITV